MIDVGRGSDLLGVELYLRLLGLVWALMCRRIGAAQHCMAALARAGNELLRRSLAWLALDIAFLGRAFIAGPVAELAAGPAAGLLLCQSDGLAALL